MLARFVRCFPGQPGVQVLGYRDTGRSRILIQPKPPTHIRDCGQLGAALAGHDHVADVVPGAVVAGQLQQLADLLGSFLSRTLRRIPVPLDGLDACRGRDAAGVPGRAVVAVLAAIRSP